MLSPTATSGNSCQTGCPSLACCNPECRYRNQYTWSTFCGFTNEPDPYGFRSDIEEIRREAVKAERTRRVWVPRERPMPSRFCRRLFAPLRLAAPRARPSYRRQRGHHPGHSPRRCA